jgi:hypothetical protein
MRPDTTRIIAELGVIAGLRRLTPHGLRHGFATAALKWRGPAEVVANRLGNTARVVLETYRHAIPTKDAKGAQLVATASDGGRRNGPPNRTVGYVATGRSSGRHQERWREAPMKAPLAPTSCACDHTVTPRPGPVLADRP